MNLNKYSPKKGFTLIELITVIAILAIIVAIAIPRLAGLREDAKSIIDNANLKTLNSATTYYASDKNISRENIFSGIATDGARMQELIDNGYLTEIIEPKQNNCSFTWNTTNKIWELTGDDPTVSEDSIITVFKNAIATSSLKYMDFLNVNKIYSGYNSNNYKTNSWNGYLEKILEKGEGDDKRVAANEGNNTIGYENPYSSKKSVVNFNNWDTFKNNYNDYIPPAILITNNSDFNFNNDSHTYIENNVNTLKGTMVFYKQNSQNNQDVQVYYIKEDGSLSDLVPIDTVLP